MDVNIDVKFAKGTKIVDLDNESVIILNSYRVHALITMAAWAAQDLRFTPTQEHYDKLSAVITAYFNSIADPKVCPKGCIQNVATMMDAVLQDWSTPAGTLEWSSGTRDKEALPATAEPIFSALLVENHLAIVLNDLYTVIDCGIPNRDQNRSMKRLIQEKLSDMRDHFHEMAHNVREGKQMVWEGSSDLLSAAR